MTPDQVGYLFEKCQKDMYREARRRLRDKSMVDDAVQRALVVALETCVDLPEDPGVLVTLARREASKIWCEQVRERYPFGKPKDTDSPARPFIVVGPHPFDGREGQDCEGLGPPAEPMDYVADTRPTPEQECFEEVPTEPPPAIGFHPEWLDLLKPEQQRVVQLYYLEEKTLEEVGAVLGVSRQAVHQQLQVALAKLRKGVKRVG